MKIKRIFILLMLLLLTGCTVDYKLDIKENGIFVETISGTVTEEELDNTGRTDLNAYLYNLNLRTPYIGEQGQYNKNIIDKDGYKEFTFNYTFNNNYDKSSAVNSCHENIRFDETDDLYYIDLSGDFYCLLSDKMTINVTSEYAVLESNAKKVVGNTYTWEIDDYNDADIYMAISKNVKHENNTESKKRITNTFRIVGLVVLIVLSGIAYFLYKNKEDKTE